MRLTGAVTETDSCTPHAHDRRRKGANALASAFTAQGLAGDLTSATLYRRATSEPEWATAFTPLSRRYHASISLHRLRAAVHPSASFLYAQSMGEMLQPEHPAAVRAVPLVRALLAGDVEGALAHGRENATAPFIGGGMEDAVRRLAVDLPDSGPYDTGSMLLATSVGVIIELRQTDGGESSALLFTTEAEPSYRITGQYDVRYSRGTLPGHAARPGRRYQRQFAGRRHTAVRCTPMSSRTR